jgi:hypothetical protein
MRRTPRFSRTRHATAVAYLALFTGLSGGAYAAATITGADILDSTIESVDVRNGTLSTHDIADGAVGTFDLQQSSVTSGKVADESLTGSDVAFGTLTGYDVADGSIGKADLAPGVGVGPATELQDSSATDSTSEKIVVELCPEGKQLLTGGGWTTGDNAVGINLSRSYLPAAAPSRSGWMVRAVEHSPTNATWSATVSVRCIDKAS